jgi:DNA-binding GntR family transcriptional regulator
MHAQRTTLADRLRDNLAEQIVTGVLIPGTRLDETDLARRYGTSRTPIREAFKALAGMGLVEQRPHRGVLVALPSRQRIEEMFEAMAELEATCARLAALRMTGAERRALERLHLGSLALVRQGDLQAYATFNNGFHDMIYRCSKNGFLEETARSVRRRVMPFRLSQFRVVGRLPGSHAEHDTVVQAILNGNATAAEAAMRAHVGKVTVASVLLVEEQRLTGLSPQPWPDEKPASRQMP